MHRTSPEGIRLLINAPYGRDADSLYKLLASGGYDVALCASLAHVAHALDERVGAIVLTEEALAADLARIHSALQAQPAWSDVPFLLLAGRQAGGRNATEIVRRRLPESALNVVVLERPLSSESLLSAIASALRGRQKQFEIRDRIADLDTERARLATLLEHLPVGVAFVGSERQTILANSAFRRFQPTGEIPANTPDGEDRWIGYEADGTRIRRDRFVAMRALRGEVVQGVEFLYRPEHGEDVWTRVSGLPLYDANGTITGSISVIVDIDQQKRSQEALAAAAHQLEHQVAERTAELQDALARLKSEAEERERAESALRQAQKMEAVGQLTGGIAHDFNNMLTGVIGAIDVLKRRLAAGRVDDLERFMEAASISAQRAAGLTQRLLAFSRRQSLDSRPTNVNALLGSLEDLLHRTMSEQVTVKLQTEEALPAAVVDPNQLENAILNLAINARDAMPDGGTLTIETSLQTLDEVYVAARPGAVAGTFVMIAVTDTGAGMSTEMIDKVFEPFFTTKPIGQGTGLGLSMVYGFAKQSNGQVRIHSTVGFGTSVKIYLPVSGSEQAVETAVCAAPVEQGTGQTVLLVEDDDSVRLLITDVLEELGYACVAAAEPDAAIKLFETERSFDLMISDVGLPGMNGRQLAYVARTFLPDLPILFVTGYAEGAAVRSGFLGENMAMITKPFQIDVLSARISEILS